MIYCAIQFEKTDIVVFDPEKKTKTSLIPPESRKPGRVNFVKGKDGKIYAKLSTSDQWFRIEGGEKLVEVSQSDIPFSKGVSQMVERLVSSTGASSELRIL